MPLISVIVPIYNSERYLIKCLDSLKEQTYNEIEVIMIDDGSTDTSAEICKEYVEKDHRFIYVRQNNAGVSAARNHGLKIAKGDYFGFCDSDDWIEKDMYETLYRMIEETGADVSVVSFALDDKKISSEKSSSNHILTFDSETALLEMHNGEKFQGHLCNKLIKRKLLNDLWLREDIAIYEDMLFMWMVFHRCNKVAFCNIPKYHYVVIQTSAMNGVLKDSYWSIQKACSEMYDNMRRYYPQHIHYAQKTVVWGNMSIAAKAFRSKVLTKDNYTRIKKEISMNYSKKAKRLFSLKQRVKIRAFLIGRSCYSCLMWLLKAK